MNRLNRIIQDVFRVDPERINDKMSPSTLSTWDSMNYLLFISEIEKEFKVTFTMDEVMNAKNLGDIKEFLEKKGAPV